MTFTYSGNPASSTRDAVRFYSQDIDIEDPLLTDEEIDFIILQWTNVTDHPMYYAAVVCETIAAKFTREISYSADGISVGSSELQTKFNQLAADLREQYKASVVGAGPDAGGIEYGETYDSSIKPLTWAKGMHDNIEAGQQDYGGSNPLTESYPERDGTYP